MIRKRGANWQVVIKRKVMLQSIGLQAGEYSYTVSTRAQAQLEHDAICAELDAGRVPQVLLDYVAGIHASTVTYGMVWTLMQADQFYAISASLAGLWGSLQDDFKDMPLADFDKACVLSWLQELKVNDIAPGTIRKKVQCLNSIAKYAALSSDCAILTNVFDQLPRNYSQHAGFQHKRDDSVKRDAERDRRLLPGEYEALTQAIADFPVDPRRRKIKHVFKPALQIMLDMAIGTAMRLQELNLCQWSHVDLKKKVIFIPAVNAKANRARYVPIAKALLPKLRKYKKITKGNDSDYVLPWFSYYELNHKKCSDAMSHTWRRIFNAAEIDDIWFHDFRHEGVSRMVERTNMSMAQLKTISGHVDDRTFARYNQLRPENLTKEFY